MREINEVGHGTGSSRARGFTDLPWAGTLSEGAQAGPLRAGQGPARPPEGYGRPRSRPKAGHPPKPPALQRSRRVIRGHSERCTGRHSGHSRSRTRRRRHRVSADRSRLTWWQVLDSNQRRLSPTSSFSIDPRERSGRHSFVVWDSGRSMAGASGRTDRIAHTSPTPTRRKAATVSVFHVMLPTDDKAMSTRSRG
jgi:hypothetical protein